VAEYGPEITDRNYRLGLAATISNEIRL